ncbi:MAG TPA: BtrH N-terminal domain-containing protein [Bacteroidia bacterium]|nr:BtrH N-terminal domain-containing protein [Bacteroidia bacterium]
MQINFSHQQSAHCENGVTVNLLNYSGLKLTEPLVFGMGSGLFFIYIPFLKVNNAPAFSYRTMPGLIFKRTCSRLGIKVIRKKFRSESEAQRILDDCLIHNQPVGCQVGVYYLTYFPKEYRFHFNAHNLVVYGKTDDRYLISDPVMEDTTSLTEFELNRVRFAKGPLAPKGQLYYPQIDAIVSDEKIVDAIKRGIKQNIRDMLYIPGPIAGVSGIKYVAKKILKWHDSLGVKTTGLYLAQLVRMQEEIGTGGGGFRYIYAAFLQQAHAYIKNDSIIKISEQFTKAGDMWRDSAIQSAGIFKGRLTDRADFVNMHDRLMQIAEVEKDAFTKLSKIKL